MFHGKHFEFFACIYLHVYLYVYTYIYIYIVNIVWTLWIARLCDWLVQVLKWQNNLPMNSRPRGFQNCSLLRTFPCMLKMTLKAMDACFPNTCQPVDPKKYSPKLRWWFQPIWKIWVKLKDIPYVNCDVCCVLIQTACVPTIFKIPFAHQWGVQF